MRSYLNLVPLKNDTLVLAVDAITEKIVLGIYNNMDSAIWERVFNF